MLEWRKVNTTRRRLLPPSGNGECPQRLQQTSSESSVVTTASIIEMKMTAICRPCYLKYRCAIITAIRPHLMQRKELTHSRKTFWIWTTSWSWGTLASSRQAQNHRESAATQQWSSTDYSNETDPSTIFTICSQYLKTFKFHHPHAERISEWYN